MTAAEIADRIAYLLHPQPHMSGRQINRLHGERRRQVEDLAVELAAEIERLRAANVGADGGSRPPMKMLVDNDWLKQKILEDADGECEAGTLHPEAQPPA